MTTKALGASTVLAGGLTEIPGRYLLSAATYELTADASPERGGPGTAPGADDLLIAAIVTALLDEIGAPRNPDARPRVAGRLQPAASFGSGRTATIEIVFEGASDDSAATMAAAAVGRCALLRLLRGVLDLDVVAYGEPVPEG